ncbi:sugar-binding domain-containing protein [uncultured Bacteroides sp.]|uniref:sugar-binding domain-containing protein n=1 Tax=uncultured Bacteroides sp. TaxID=162156 RepID=UPI002AAC3F01|nr:sugar-binding domain-containing protein [uncultured Bacteroides sp.]
MKNTFLFLLIAFLLPVESFANKNTFNENERAKYNFNPEWLLFVGDSTGAEQPKFNDASWKKITLPHAFNEDDAFKVAIDKHTTGIVWYRKHFKLPLTAKDKKVFLEFQGVRQGGEFYLNGKAIGIHENGIMACGFDISNLVNYGKKENIIAVRIDNSWNYKEKSTGSNFQWNDKNFNANYGGIPKNVLLHITPKTYQTLPLYSNLQTTGTYIYPRDIDIKQQSAVICVESEVKNETKKPQEISLEAYIEDMNGEIIKEIKGESKTLATGEKSLLKANDKVSGLHFWSWGYGYLYNVYTVLQIDGKAIDVVKTRTGFRKTNFEKGMVYLNNRVLQMKGYAQRTSNEWPSVGMSVPAWLSDFSNGLMVKSNGNLVRWMHITPWKQDVESCDRVGLIQAMPAGDSEKDITGRRWEQRKEVMRDAIIYNRNNPSILFYESGNKGISEEHMKEMKAIRDLYDPCGGRAIGSREMLDSKIAEYGGEMLYINKSGRHPMWAMEYSRDEALRKYWDEFTPPYHKNGAGPLYKGQDAFDYNRNQDSHAIEDIIRWYDYFRERPGTGERVNSGGVNIVFSDSNTHFRGEENYRRSGEVDAMRLPKDGFFVHQVMWDGWVDVEKPHTHIIGHWNYTPQVKKDISVASNGSKVELLLNGKSLGFGEQSYQFLFTFKNVQWEAGELTAVSYNKDVKAISRDELRTAGAPFTIRLKSYESADGLIADGADMALIEFEVVDKDGNRCPTANNLVSFKLDGPAEWRGGIAQGKDNYILSKELPVECGVNRVLIRTLTNAGKINLTASSDGLQAAFLSLTSKTVKGGNGLSEYFQGEHLPSNLERGATPSTPSYTVSRIPLHILKTTAGSNEDKALFSYDDNEESEWNSNGEQGKNWITYQLERNDTISELVFKMNSWRNKSYPIRITIDGKEVFKGDTEKSLGYITIPIVPTCGQFVKVELIGKNKEQDAFNLVEITGKKEIKEQDKSGKQLGIVEVEVYKK